MYTRKSLFLLVLLPCFFSTIPTLSHAADPAALSIIQQMIESSAKIKTLRFKLEKKERINGKMLENAGRIKMQKTPYRVYMKQEFPKVGMEILLKPGWNNDKALINTNGFPWVNVSLDPEGAKMRENQHHCLYQSGFTMGMKILDRILFTKYKGKADGMVEIKNHIMWKGQDCYQISLDNPDFKLEDYTVKAGETVLSIAEDRMVNGYMILENNHDIANYWSIDAGDVIKVPNDYASKMIIHVDKKRMVPLFMQVYDDRGLFEQYEYLDLQINPTITAEEFTPEYADYGF